MSTATLLADCLTKVMETTYIREVLQLGTFQPYDEDLILRTKATRKYGITWAQDPMKNRDLCVF